MIGEFHAALLQGIVTLGTAALCWFLFARYRKDFFLWWSIAWSLYVLRIGAILAFLTTNAPPTDNPWLFVHQVLTGWTALALLWAALAFAQAAQWRRRYALALAFPLVWSWIAIYELQSFLLAAVPAVLFLSIATLSTAWVFYQRRRATGSRGSALLAGVLLLWGLHHFDYPILRAQGAWNPWGYYLDILFILAMGIGIVILGLEELDKRARDLARLSSRMLQQHEEERRRVSLELHDQTAQVWAAVRMQLGLIREAAPVQLSPRLDRALELVDRGIESIRGVTTHLRPPLIDDLGLVPALRALVDTFVTQAGLSIAFHAPERLPQLSKDASVALFRALQEALSNVARHSGATAVDIRLAVVGGELTLIVRDNGRGFPRTTDESSTLGLGGMRERIAALNGTVTLASDPGASITVRVPIHDT
jgi:signal transduction histidine kinase